MINVLMVGPARTAKGGMTTVVDNYFNHGLSKQVNLKYIETINDHNKISKLIKEMIGFQEYKKCIGNYDVIHIHMASRRSTFRKIRYIKYAKKHQKKVIVHMHGGGFQKFYDEECSFRQKKYIKKNLNLADKIIVLSEEWEKYFANIVEEDKIEIIYNGVKLPQNYNKNLNNTNILFLGRINEKKGIYDLLKVVKKISKKYPNVCLYVGGTGEVENLSSNIKKLGLRNNVKILGWISSKEKDDILRKCCYFILPSYFEAMPMSILEAMSYKCITVSTSVGSIPKIIQNNINGIIVQPGDVDSIENNLLNLFSNEILRKKISESARKTVEKQYDIEKLLIKLEKLYEKIC